MANSPGQGRIHQVYIGLGSNINPEQNLPLALTLLSQHVQVVAVSRVWETQPVESVGANFLNAAALISTQLSAQLLKNVVLRPIESYVGRRRSFNKNAPRQIDLDILIYNSQILDRKIWKRAFLAVPLAELLPDIRHPDTHETLQEIAVRLAAKEVLIPRPDITLVSAS